MHPLHWGAVTALFPCLSRPGGVRSPWLYQPWTPQHLWWFLASLPTHLSAVLSLSSLGHTYLGAIHFLPRFRQTHPCTMMFILGRVATCKYVLWCTPFHDHPQKKAPEKLSLPFPWTSANWAPVGEWSLLRTKLASALFFWGQSEKLYGVKELTSATLVAESGLVGALCQLMLGLLLFPIRGETHKESCLHIILLHTCLNL